jgi:hypothetical protein
MKKKKCLFVIATVCILLLSTSGSLAFVESNILSYEPSGKPYGPTEGEINIPYTFCIDLPNDVECKPYSVIWDFSDGYISEWSWPYDAGESVCEMHSWSKPGYYDIIAGIRDGCENEYWTEPLIIHITENNAPSKPIISGPTHGKIGVMYYWTFLSSDPEGENITYYIDWGDYCGSSEWNGPHPSGKEVQIAHTYYYVKDFTFSSFAADEQGKESDWTGFTINISRSKTIIPILQLIIERFPKVVNVILNLLRL